VIAVSVEFYHEASIRVGEIGPTDESAAIIAYLVLRGGHRQKRLVDDPAKLVLENTLVGAHPLGPLLNQLPNHTDASAALSTDVFKQTLELAQRSKAISKNLVEGTNGQARS
jgi:hypothetical protein